MRIDLTWFSYAMAVVVAYYLMLYVLGRRGVAVPYIDRVDRPLVIVVIPARNEELVIAETVRSALAVTYDGEHRVLVVDDASSDRTHELAAPYARSDSRVRVLHRSAEIGGRGKGDVLNHAFAVVRRWRADDDSWLAAYPSSKIVLCIVDADGRLSERSLNDATAFFRSHRVGAVQLGVQIRNARRNLLARLQDMEFVGFSFMVQTARDRLGSVGLGGNGQFTRLSSLETLGDTPWTAAALTEDLDLGLRLMMQGWRLRFCSTAWVDQQGLTRLRPFMRQRTRWAQGHYQCWRHLPALMRCRRLRMLSRVDNIAYLVLVAMVIVVSAVLGLRLLGAAGIVDPTNAFLPWLGSGIAFRLTTFLLSWLPLILTVDTYQRYAVNPLRWWEWPTFCVVFAAYVYLWALATLRAWTRLILRRGSWVKTPRVSSRGRHALLPDGELANRA